MITIRCQRGRRVVGGGAGRVDCHFVPSHHQRPSSLYCVATLAFLVTPYFGKSRRRNPTLSVTGSGARRASPLERSLRGGRAPLQVTGFDRLQDGERLRVPAPQKALVFGHQRRVLLPAAAQRVGAP